MSANPETEVVWDALRSIPDPEYGISIVDMGLIYEVQCGEEKIAVTMTLTTPNCPSGEWIYEGVKTALNRLEGGRDVNVEMTFEPPWTPDMLSKAGRHELGL